ncbi:entericidin A/B family lipoprotein [Chelativorans sp. J32]|uniref:entericidin domain-containing protein n=1 Tax=Chelativorans sp. J32 TaxID=935840 RepID=UPI00047F2FF7|nr:entericidin A/B family lipoprotein [Chelativorans sp. J32]
MSAKILSRIAVLVAAICLTAGCANTIRGVGQDTANAVNATQNAGQNVANAAER